MPDTESWEGVRAQFNLDPDIIHMAGLLPASHPEPVHKAIEKYRLELTAILQGMSMKISFQ